MKLSIFVVILTLMVAELNAAGKGCVWTGCTYSGNRCATGVASASGRPLSYGPSSKCGWGGREDFCCDTDCGYQACGYTCAGLNMNSYQSQMKDTQCDFPFEFPGIGKIKSLSQFCCPK